MNLETASLILRMQIALIDEGIGPHNPQPGDETLVQEAVRLADHLISPASLHYADLITLDRYHELTGAPR